MSLLDIYKDTKAEQATITSVDKLTGRVGLFLRNGLESTGSYMYDINDLRVGLSVLVTKVNNFYVILNRITSDSTRKSYSSSIGTTVPKPPSTCIGTIGHTFSNNIMVPSTTQWFYINAGGIRPHTRYVWSLEGIGSFTFVGNHQVMYNSPAYGGEAVITLSLEDGTVCDSFTVYVCEAGCVATIGYTTQQMTTSGTQTLTVVDPDPIGACQDYTWEITSGGGSLSLLAGLTTVYTAPATNPNCIENPIITLKNGSVVCDTLQIAVTATSILGYPTSSLDAATRNIGGYDEAMSNGSIDSCSGLPYSGGYGYTWGANCSHSIRCDGSESAKGWNTACSAGTANGCCRNYDCSSHPTWAEQYDHEPYPPTDYRTVWMKTGGCCPQQLL